MKNTQALFVAPLCVLLLAACSQQETVPRLGLEVPLRIMPMGDSITEGLCDTPDTCEEPVEWMIPTSGDGVEACAWAANPYNPEAVGYRAFLRDMIAAKGLDMSYAGSVTVVEGLAHEGHSGWQIRDLDYCVQNGDWLEKAQPNVILLHIGTNDASEGREPEEMAQSLLALLQHIYEKVPASTEVIVAQIIPARQSWMKSVITPYNELIPGVVDKLVAEGKHASYVDMTGVILSDADLDRFGHHPNVAASERMAQVWYAKIVDVVGQKP